MKKEKKLLFLRWTLLIAMALLVCNCQKEELPTDVENTAMPISQSTIQKIQYELLPSYIKDQVTYSTEIIQDKRQLGKRSEAFGEILQDQVGVLTTTKGVTSYTLGMENLGDCNGLNIDNLVITENSEGILSSQILRYKPADEWLQNRSSKGLNWGTYTGEIFIYDSHGKLNAAGEFLNGNAIGKTSNKAMAGRDDVMDCVVTEVSVGGLEQNGEFYPTDIIVDYECSGGGGTSGDSGGLLNEGGELPQNGGEAHGGGSSGDGGSSGGGQIPTLIDDRLLFDKIDIDGSVKPCVLDIIKKLVLKDIQNLTVPDIGQLAGTKHLSQIILEMFDGSSDYHLNFRIEDATTSIGTKRNAFTNPRRNYPSNRQWTFDIVLDKNFVNNATQLAIARTIIHESLHAYLYYTTQTYSTAPFSQLFYQYDALNNDVNVSQHELMTQLTTAIGYSLSVYDGANNSLDYYENLAWSGDMLKTVEFKALDSSRQSAIRSANKNEGDAVNPANRSAKGTKCP